MASPSIPFEMTIRAPDVANLDPVRTRYGFILGGVALSTIRRRVQVSHQDATGKALPPYRVDLGPDRHIYKRQRRTGKYRRRGEMSWMEGPWDETKKGPPPDIKAQIWREGGKAIAAKPGQNPGDMPNATPLYYSPYTIAKGKALGKRALKHEKKRAGEQETSTKPRGLFWGWLWKARLPYLDDVCGGPAVDHTRTGEMWDSVQLRVKATKRGRWAKEVGIFLRFRGANPSGNPRDVAKAYRYKRYVPPSIKALLCNSRGSDGKIAKTGGEARQWLQVTPTEGSNLTRVWAQLIGEEYARIDERVVRIKVLPGGAVVKTESREKSTNSRGFTRRGSAGFSSSYNSTMTRYSAWHAERVEFVDGAD